MNALSMCNRPLGVIGLNESSVVAIVWYISNVSCYEEGLGAGKPHNLEILIYAFFEGTWKRWRRKTSWMLYRRQWCTGLHAADLGVQQSSEVWRRRTSSLGVEDLDTVAGSEKRSGNYYCTCSDPTSWVPLYSLNLKVKLVLNTFGFVETSWVS